MPQDPKNFKYGSDASDSLANEGQVIEFYQVPSMRLVKFKSFLTQYEDTYSSKWQRTPVFGKMDPIHTFQHTQREINLGWDVLAGSLNEAIENQQKLSLLIKMLYPSYTGSDKHDLGWNKNEGKFLEKSFPYGTEDVFIALDPADPSKADGSSDLTKTLQKSQFDIFATLREKWGVED